MRNITKHEVYGEIIYDESFFTGKKEVYINGVKLAKVDKKTYSYRTRVKLTDEFGNVIYNEYDAPLTKEINKNVEIKGNFLYGSTITIDNEEIEVSPKAKWFEIVLALFAPIFVVIWGNSASLCEIFPVVGGFIGGFLSCLISFSGFAIMKTKTSVLQKILVGLGFAVLSVLACFIVGLMLVSMAA